MRRASVYPRYHDEYFAAEADAIVPVRDATEARRASPHTQTRSGVVKDAPRDGTRILAFHANASEWIIVHWCKTGSEPFGKSPAWVTDLEGPGYSSGFGDAELSAWVALPDNPRVNDAGR